MASTYTDDDSTTSRVLTASPSTTMSLESQRSSRGLMDQLPPGYVTRNFTNMRRLRLAATEILQSLQNNESQNQWLVVLGLSSRTIEQLASDNSLLDVAYRFQWEGQCGLIKVIPSGAHDVITGRVVIAINEVLSSMGVSLADGDWMRATTYRPTTGRGKEADDCFVPPSRCNTQVAQTGWPTFVIETGMSESLSQLRQDARNWFADSEGKVRLVLVIGIKDHRVDLELWQLAPLGAPLPLTRLYIEGLCAQFPNIPPTSHQPASIQQPYCAQEVTITPRTVDGAPLYIPFVSIFDRLPTGGEGDIVLTDAACRTITRRFWSTVAG